MWSDGDTFDVPEQMYGIVEEPETLASKIKRGIRIFLLITSVLVFILCTVGMINYARLASSIGKYVFYLHWDMYGDVFFYFSWVASYALLIPILFSSMIIAYFTVSRLQTNGVRIIISVLSTIAVLVFIFLAIYSLITLSSVVETTNEARSCYQCLNETECMYTPIENPNRGRCYYCTDKTIMTTNSSDPMRTCLKKFDISTFDPKEIIFIMKFGSTVTIISIIILFINSVITCAYNFPPAKSSIRFQQNYKQPYVALVPIPS